jgi:tRNA(fMet)-specific endonuclease VapC
MNYLLDTNICIYCINEKPFVVLSKLRSIPFGQISISSLTVAELEYGAEKSSRPDKNRLSLLKFLSPFEIIQYNEDDARAYGACRQFLEKKGQLIGAIDLLIASQAVSREMILVTNNEKEFKRVPNIKIENWTKKI